VPESLAAYPVCIFDEHEEGRDGVGSDARVPGLRRGPSAAGSSRSADLSANATVARVNALGLKCAPAGAHHRRTTV